MLLADARIARSMGLQELASTSFFTVADLVAVESGARDLTDLDLRELLAVYAVEPTDLVPERAELVVDLDERRLSAGGEHHSLAGPYPSPDQVLASYLSLVYTLRHRAPGTELILREADVDVLAQALHLARPAVTTRLHQLMVEPAGEVQRRAHLLRGRVLVPLAGAVVAATALGTLLLVPSDAGGQSVDPAGGSEPAPAFVMTNPDGSTTPVYVGDGLDVDSLPPGAVGLAPATQTAPGGPTVVQGDGLVVPSELPADEVCVADPQVAVRNPDGTVTQSAITDGAGEP
jgi:hypothetical protein